MLAGNYWQSCQSKRWERNESSMQAFFSREKIHKQFKARIFKGVVNVYLPENVLKLTLFCPSSQPSVGSLEVIKSQRFCIGLSS